MNIEIIHDAGENYGFTEPAETIHPALTEHNRFFKKCIYRCANRFYLAVGYGIANITIVDGEAGLIIIDTAESKEVAQEVMRDFRKTTGNEKPVKCVIYTHNHYDHVGGVKGIVDVEAVESGECCIIANERICCGIRNTASILGNIINIRAAYTFGLLLEKGATGSVNEGIGSKLCIGTSTYIPPTIMFNQRLDKTVEGVRMELYYAPSETDDELFVWFPDDCVLQSADIIMGPCYPNIYSIRGTQDRSAVKWYNAIDHMRTFRAQYLVPSHGIPMEGRQNIEQMLTDYRDAIQWTHDQTVRLMNQGLKPNGLMQRLNRLPEHLAANPWLSEHYGAVAHCVPQIYNGYLGWFQGDPTALQPLPEMDESVRYCEMMGGIEKVYAVAHDNWGKAMAVPKDTDAGKAERVREFTWISTMCTHLIRANPDNKEARELKASCHTELAYMTANPNWRNWYLTSAMELRDLIDYDYLMAMNGVDSDDILSEIPLECFLRGFCVKLDPEKSKGMHYTFGFYIRDTDDICESYALEIRRCVAQFHKPAPETTHYGVIIGRRDCRNLLLNKEDNYEDLIESGRMLFYNETRLEHVRMFFGKFDLVKSAVRITDPAGNGEKK